MKGIWYFFPLFLLVLFAFKPVEKTTASLLGIWVNPTNDVKIKIEEVKDETRAVLYWSSRQEVTSHIGKIVIKQILMIH